MTATFADVESQTETGTDEPDCIHITCCRDMLFPYAHCGRDVSGDPWVDHNPDRECDVCHDRFHHGTCATTCPRLLFGGDDVGIKT